MDNIGGLLFLAVLWIVGTIFERMRKAQRRQRSVPSPPPPPRSVGSAPEKGSTLERALRHLNTELAGAMEAAREEYARKTEPPERQTQPVVWDGESLEVEPSPTRLRPEAVDLDDESRLAIDRRLREVEVRNRPRTDRDHAKFHDAIRKPAAEHATQSTLPSKAELRRAIIWNEILGPPVGLR